MSALNLRLPDSIHRHIREVAKKEGVSINQFISTAVTEKISAIMAGRYLEGRSARAQKNDLKNYWPKCQTGNLLLGMSDRICLLHSLFLYPFLVIPASCWPETFWRDTCQKPQV